MGLRASYTVFAPVYDALIARGSARTRVDSLKRITFSDGHQVLLCGVGTGLDIPWLPSGPAYHGIDLTPAMIKRASLRAQEHDHRISLHIGDVMNLPFRNDIFDTVIMHLILAVIPSPEQALMEAERVLKPGGHILILDKFLRPGQSAPLRRLINPLARRLATRLDVVFEDTFEHCRQLQLLENNPTDLSGWFRHIVLRKNEPE